MSERVSITYVYLLKFSITYVCLHIHVYIYDKLEVNKVCHTFLATKLEGANVYLTFTIIARLIK